MQETIDFYSGIATQFHASYQTDHSRKERLHVWKASINRYAKNVKSAYDMGCGSGILACELAKNNIRTIAIDGSAKMLEIASDSANELKLNNIEFRQHHLPLEQTESMEKTGLLISSSAIEYLESVNKALISFRKLLEKDGIIMFSVSNHDALSRKLVRLIHTYTGQPHYLKFLHHFMTAQTVKSELVMAGFEPLDCIYFGKVDFLNRFLSCFLPEKFCSNMMLAIARKKAHE